MNYAADFSNWLTYAPLILLVLATILLLMFRDD